MGSPEIHDCSPWIPLNIAIPYKLLVCIRYTLAFLGLVSFYLSLSPFPTEKVHCRDRDEPVCRCIEKKERQRERERDEKTEETKQSQSGEEKYSFFSVISIRVSVSTSRRSCTEDLVVRATRERSSGSLHRSLHRGARSFARLTRQCRITSRIIPRVGT